MCGMSSILERLQIRVAKEGEDGIYELLRAKESKALKHAVSRVFSGQNQ
jgi:hypothetical protein